MDYILIVGAENGILNQMRMAGDGDRSEDGYDCDEIED